ncbi:TPA: hypothetical protein JLG49_000763 [Escherichia coli]|nr:hypothetical protein [Escherichia coli]HAV9485320.1 hypothetical protein [Escherichia coli]HAV9574207.1 hypothetical protein [Escherichia coli]HAW4201229.1 hypothetical protein [Escherichia coli]
MEFKDLPVPFQEMAANVVRSQLATLDLSTVEKETIDNISHNVRNAFIKLYEEKLSSENKDYSPKFTPHPGGVNEIYHETMVKALRMQIAELEHKLNLVSKC